MDAFEFRLSALALSLASAFSALLLSQAAVAQSNPATTITLPFDNVLKSPGESVPGMSAELMYRLLVADIALQRGEPAVAARSYYESARELQNATLARRATEIGVAARQMGVALEAAKLWSELDQSSERPKQIIAQITSGLAAKGANDGIDIDLKAQLERALADAAASPPALADAFLQLNRVLAQDTDKAAAFKMVTLLVQPYPKVPEAQFALALAALNAGLGDVAMMNTATQAIDRALAQKPTWDRAALLKAEILAKRSSGAAIDFLEMFVKDDPKSRPAWGALAQFYVEQKRYGDARTIFQRLWDEDKSAREFEFGIAVLSMQMKDWPAAEALFEDLRNADYGENGVVELHLAQIAEDSGRYELAIERYKGVPEGERGWLASLRVAAMMGKLGRVQEARQYLAELNAVTVEQQVQVRQSDAQLLKDAGDNTGAFKVLDSALTAHPDEPDLLYDMAMVAEKLDKIDVTEKQLKRLIELKPDNAQALNALGYTLVDRTPRTAEGIDFIERALKLEPADPFILDSMGWALFRLGKVDEALDYLRRAMAERPDAEIAAHLGEVLWSKGERTAAQEVWQSQLRTTPDNPLLQHTVKRLAQ